MICGKNPALDAAKDKTKELKSLLQGGKDQLAAMQSKLNEIQAEVNSFKPEIPTVDSLQQRLSDLININSPIDFAAEIAEIKAKFGEKVPDLNALISDLGLNSFPPTIDLDTICAKIPNVEEKDGEVKEQPAEPKVPEVEPVVEEPPPVVEKLEYEYNREYFDFVKRKAIKLIGEKTKKLTGSKKVNFLFLELTGQELFVEIADATGTTYDELKFRAYDQEGFRRGQGTLLSQNPDVTWDFLAEGRILEKTWLEYKASNGPNAGDFRTAMKEAAERRSKKLEEKANA